MSKDCCCLWVFGIILVLLFPIQTPIEEPDEYIPEEEVEVKYGQFDAVSGTNDDLEDLQNFKNLAESDMFNFIKSKIDEY